MIQAGSLREIHPRAPPVRNTPPAALDRKADRVTQSVGLFWQARASLPSDVSPPRCQNLSLGRTGQHGFPRRLTHKPYPVGLQGAHLPTLTSVSASVAVSTFCPSDSRRPRRWVPWRSPLRCALQVSEWRRCSTRAALTSQLAGHGSWVQGVGKFSCQMGPLRCSDDPTEQPAVTDKHGLRSLLIHPTSLPGYVTLGTFWQSVSGFLLSLPL